MELFSLLEDSDDALIKYLGTLDPSDALSLLLSANYDNRDGRFGFEAEDEALIGDANALLGLGHNDVGSVNILQAAIFLGDEDLAIAILKFASQLTAQLSLRKMLLLEWVAKPMSGGNTSLHLASFLGMSSAVRELLRIGAPVGKINQRKYRAVDCADDDETRNLFMNYESSIEKLNSNGQRIAINSNKAMNESVNNQPLSNTLSNNDDHQISSIGIHNSLTISQQNENEQQQSSHSLKRQKELSTSQISLASLNESLPFSPVSLTDVPLSSSQGTMAKDVNNSKKSLASPKKKQKRVSFDSASLFLDCIISGDLATVKMLWPSNISTLTAKGMAPLALAAHWGHLPLVKFFISATTSGGTNNTKNVNVRGSNGSVGRISLPSTAATPALIGKNSGSVNSVEITQPAPVHFASSHSRTSSSSVSQLHQLLPSSIIDAVDDEGWTALMHAAGEGHADICKYLIESANAKTDIINYDGEELADVVDEGNAEMIDLMHKYGIAKKE